MGSGDLVAAIQQIKAKRRKDRKAKKRKDAAVARLEAKLEAGRIAAKSPTRPAQKRAAAQRPVFVGGRNVVSDEFLSTFEWRRVRMMALKKYGPVCQCCGATPQTGAVMNVDHIKPRRLFPQLALDADQAEHMRAIAAGL